MGANTLTDTASDLWPRVTQFALRQVRARHEAAGIRHDRRVKGAGLFNAHVGCYAGRLDSVASSVIEVIPIVMAIFNSKSSACRNIVKT